jgi:hypothetical protein
MVHEGVSSNGNEDVARRNGHDRQNPDLDDLEEFDFSHDKRELPTFSLEDEDRAVLEAQERREQTPLENAAQFVGQKAQAVYEQLGDKARHVIGLVYENIPPEIKERVKIWKGQMLFHAVEMYYGNPAEKAKRNAEEMASRERLVAEHQKSRQRLSAANPAFIESDLGKKIVAEENSAREFILQKQAESGSIRSAQEAVDEKRIVFETERARRASRMIDLADREIEAIQEHARPYEVERDKLSAELTRTRTSLDAYEVELQNVWRAADTIGDPDSKESQSYLRIGEAIKKEIISFKKLIKDREDKLVQNNTRLGSIQAMAKPFEEKRKIYLTLIVTELPKREDVPTTISKNLDKEMADPESEELSIKDEIKHAEKYISRTYPDVPDEVRNNWIEAFRENLHKKANDLEANKGIARRFEGSETTMALFNTIDMVYKERHISRDAREQLKDDVMDVLSGNKSTRIIPEEYGLRSAVERLMEKAAYDAKGIPRDIAWGPESASELHTVHPDMYLQTWNEYMGAGKDKQMFRLSEKIFSKLFAGYAQVSLEDLEQASRQYLGEEYARKNQRRLDPAFHREVEKIIHSVHERVIRN